MSESFSLVRNLFYVSLNLYIKFNIQCLFDNYLANMCNTIDAGDDLQDFLSIQDANTDPYVFRNINLS